MAASKACRLIPALYPSRVMNISCFPVAPLWSIPVGPSALFGLLRRSSPLVARGWRAPGECRAVTPQEHGGARRAPAAAIFPSPGELYALLSSIPVGPLCAIPVGLTQPSSVSCGPPRSLGRRVQALRAAGRSADGPAGNAPSAGLRIRSAGAPLPAPRTERLMSAPLRGRGCRSIWGRFGERG